MKFKLRALVSLISLLWTLLLATPAAQAQQPAPVVSASAVAVAASAPNDARPTNGQEPQPNPYGMVTLWQTSDAVAKAVLLLLVLMSASSWYVAIVKLLDQTRMARQGRAAVTEFWPAGTIEQGAVRLQADSPYRHIVDAATHALEKHEGLMGHIPLNDWVSMSIQRAVERVQSHTQSGLALLATVGSIAPFVGLFGTVWGIYHALTAIGIAGQASIDKVAGPVGEALIMTAIGLAVAVPAVLAYNWLVRRNKAIMDEVRAFSQDLHSVVLGTVNKA